MDVLMQDLRFALRSLRRAPGFSALVVVILGLGIGVNAMMFSMVYGILYRPWPLPEFDRVVRIIQRTPTGGDDDQYNLGYPTFEDIRRRAKSFEAIGAFWDHNAFVVIDRDVERMYGATVTAGLFDALGVKPVLGRGFTPEENHIGNNWGTVIISHRIWKDRYGGRADVLGRTLRLNGRVRTIVGVMPPGFEWPEFQEFWIPMGLDPATDTRENTFMMTAARLKPGVSVKQADAEVAAIVATTMREYPPGMRDLRTHAIGWAENWAHSVRPMMMLMFGAVVFVLLVACANVANLLLARATSRRREIGVRLSLGASRGRILRQLLTESLVLSAAGALLGVLLAHLGNRIWISAIPIEKPFYMNFDIDAPVLAYTVAVTVAATLLFGLAPAVHATDLHLTEALRDGGAQAGGSAGRHRMRSVLVVAEVALSLVLLVGAGLFLRSFFRVVERGQTLRTENMLTAQVLLPFASHPTDSAKVAYFSQLLPALRTLPGVKRVSAVSLLPLNRNSNVSAVTSSRQPDLKASEAPRSNQSSVYPGYFETIGIPLLRGRDFTDADQTHSQRVVIVNQALAKRLWPGRDPIGERLKFVGQPDSIGWFTVVGMVGNVTQNVEGTTLEPSLFVPHPQNTDQTMTLLLESPRDPASLTADVRRVVRGLHPDVALYEVRTLPEALRYSLWTRRLFTGLMSVFGVLALVIAAVGLYGVMAYSVAQRTHEIGIRMALGAAHDQVARMVVAQALRLTTLGLGIGLAAAWGLTRGLASQLFEIRPDDPPTYVGVTTVLVLSSLLAAWLPARRATRVNPMIALRSDCRWGRAARAALRAPLRA